MFPSVVRVQVRCNTFFCLFFLYFFRLNNYVDGWRDGYHTRNYLFVFLSHAVRLLCKGTHTIPHTPYF